MSRTSSKALLAMYPMRSIPNVHSASLTERPFRTDLPYAKRLKRLERTHSIAPIMPSTRATNSARVA